MRRSTFSFLALLACAPSVGCATAGWQPPPPQGQTYRYEDQGFRASGTTVVAGSGRYGPSYGAVFGFREARGVQPVAPGKDPFVQSAPIDGYRFNTHLGPQGARLVPGAGPGAESSAGGQR